MRVGDGGTAGALGTGATTNSGSLVFNRSDALTVASAVSHSSPSPIDNGSTSGAVPMVPLS